MLRRMQRDRSEAAPAGGDLGVNSHRPTLNILVHSTAQNSSDNHVGRCKLAITAKQGIARRSDMPRRWQLNAGITCSQLANGTDGKTDGSWSCGEGASHNEMQQI